MKKIKHGEDFLLEIKATQNQMAKIKNVLTVMRINHAIKEDAPMWIFEIETSCESVGAVVKLFQYCQP